MALSDGEFDRMQAQLLELRTDNYQLNDKCKLQEREIGTARDQMTHLERELFRANQALNRSKKAKEFEQLMRENDLLEQKLRNQEDDFRLQNEALMKELAQLVSTNEALEKDIAQLKEDSVTSEAMLSLQDTVRRLQAQNSALQHSISSNQESHKAEVVHLKQVTAEMESSTASKPASPAVRTPHKREGHSRNPVN